MSVMKRTISLTPKLASELLGRNLSNRAYRAGRAESLASAIAAGLFVNNHQPIIVDEDGNLLDGQHRCGAVVLSDIPIDTDIVYGADKDIFHTLDSGKARTASDVLFIMGCSRPTMVAATLRIVHRDNMGVLHLLVTRHEATNAQIAQMKERSLVEASVEAVSKHKHTSTAACAFFHYLTFKNGPRDVAEAFWSGVFDGEDLKAGDPAKSVRDRLLSGVVGRRLNNKVGQRSILDTLIKGWIHELARLPLSDKFKPGIFQNQNMYADADRKILNIPMTEKEAEAALRRVRTPVAPKRNA